MSANKSKTLTRTNSQNQSNIAKPANKTIPKVQTQTSTISNLYKVKRSPVDRIYVNPSVTREGQRKLATKLYAEIADEATLEENFKKREIPVRNKDPAQDNAKIFNDFCVDFIDKSKGTKENVLNVINDASDRISALEETKRHLVEVERMTYRFEMNLPDPLTNNEKHEDEEDEEDI